jgi:hypothetical protein
MKVDENTSLLQFHYAFTFSELPAVAFTFLNCPSVAMALRICPSFCSFVNMTRIPLSWVIISSLPSLEVHNPRVEPGVAFGELQGGDKPEGHNQSLPKKKTTVVAVEEANFS